MKLEVGNYIRTKNGTITKIISKEDVSGSLHREEIVFILDNGNRLALHSKKVVKASHNIIDLIEEGDYVNGYKIVLIRGIKNIITENGVEFFGIFHINDIKSIVTKEQFESMGYKVKE